MKLNILLFLFVVLQVPVHAQLPVKAWEKFINGSTPDEGQVDDILIDQDHCIVLSRNEEDYMAVVLSKYTLNGVLIWSKKWAVATTDIYPYYLQKNTRNGHYYVLGYADGGQPYITEFDLNGNRIKTKVFNDNLQDFKALRDGTFIVAGTKTIYKVNMNLDIVWSKAIKFNFSRGVCCTDLNSIDVSPDGSIYLLASGTGILATNTAADIVVAKTDSLGNVIWNKVFGGSGTESISDSYANFRSDIKAHPDGGFVLECSTRSLEFAPQGTSSHIELLVIKGDKDGNQKWWATSNKGAGSAHGVKIKPNGNILVYGVGGTSSTSPFASPADKSNRAYILELNHTNGSKVWASSFGGEYSDFTRALAVVDDRRLIAGGKFSKSSSFDSYAWLFSVNISGLSATREISDEALGIYPNPTTDFVQIEHGTFVPEHYWISNLQGAMVKSGSVSIENRIDFRELEPGIYLLNLESEGKLVRKKIVKI